MSRFQLIDDKLANLANKLNAKLTKDRPEYPESLRTFEERRIDWIDDKISKAIIIQPNFEDSGVNQTIWNFINLAYLFEEWPIKNKKWIKYLVDKEKFEIIDKNIDDLLNKSEENLKRIKIEDLQ